MVLALALALQPEVLLLDEVTSALDYEAVLKVEKALKACGAALIWVTHNDDQPARWAGLPDAVMCSFLNADAAHSFAMHHQYAGKHARKYQAGILNLGQSGVCGTMAFLQGIQSFRSLPSSAEISLA